MSLIHDETGKVSTARSAFWLTLVITLSLVVADALSTAVDLPDPAYALLSGLTIALAAWAGGPRMAQYLAPAASQVASAVAAAKRDRKAGIEPTP